MMCEKHRTWATWLSAEHAVNSVDLVPEADKNKSGYSGISYWCTVTAHMQSQKI